MPQGEAKLEGAEYTIKYYDNPTLTLAQSNTLTPKKTWIFKTDKYGEIDLGYAEDYFVSGDSFYTNSAGYFTIPAGSITIQETKAPTGYAINSEKKIVHFTIQSDGTVRADSGNWNTTNQANDISTLSKENTEPPSPITFTKNDWYTGETPYGTGSFEGIRFAVVNESTNPVVNPAGVEIPKGKVIKVVESTAAGKIAVGDLVYGKYALVELAVEDTVSADGTLTLGNSLAANDTYAVSDRIGVRPRLEFNTMGQANTDTIFTDHILIRTRTRDVETGTQYGNGENEIHFVDEVEYRDLYEGHEYVLKATLINKETHMPFIDADGNEVVKVWEFIAEPGINTVKVEFDPFTVEYGAACVVFEELFEKEVYETPSLNPVDPTVPEDEMEPKPVTYHKDETDEGQWFNPVLIHTKAYDDVTHDNITFAGPGVIIHDDVLMEGLNPGASYTIRAVLRNRDTWEPILDDAGNEVTTVLPFTATAVTQTLTVTFEFDGETLAGTTMVACEYLDLTAEAITIATHESPSDPSQTIFMPAISTLFLDDFTETDHAFKREIVEATDTFKYTDLLADGLHEYELKSYLVDRETAAFIVDENGDRIEGKLEDGGTTFTPEDGKEEDELKVHFEIPWELIDGKALVCYEQIFLLGDLVAEECDITSEDQDIFGPSIKTTLLDSETLDHVSNPDGDITLPDRVDCTGLKPHTKYIAKGQLMFKDGTPVLDDNGDPIFAEAPFVTGDADEGKATVTTYAIVTFTFSGVNLKGLDVIAFEDLELAATGKVVAEHHDTESPEQTVKFPKVSTTLIDAGTETKTAHIAEKDVLPDTVTVENLLGDRWYRLHGKLFVRETGEFLKDKNGDLIEAELDFYVSEDDEEKTIKVLDFTVDTTEEVLWGKTLVAYEELDYLGKSKEPETPSNPDDTPEYHPEDEENKPEPDEHTPVGDHSDPTSEPQSVYVASLGTTARDKDSDTNELKLTRFSSRVITDKLKYTGLTEGKTYYIVAELFDKTTGKLTDITAEGKFIPEKMTDIASIDIEIPKDEIYETTYVVFEHVYTDGVDENGEKTRLLVAEHCDENDESQSVKVTIPNGGAVVGGPKWRGSSKVQILGIRVNSLAFLGLTLLSILLTVLAVFFVNMHRENRKKLVVTAVRILPALVLLAATLLPLKSYADDEIYETTKENVPFENGSFMESIETEIELDGTKYELLKDEIGIEENEIERLTCDVDSEKLFSVSVNPNTGVAVYTRPKSPAFDKEIEKDGVKYTLSKVTSEKKTETGRTATAYAEVERNSTKEGDASNNFLAETYFDPDVNAIRELSGEEYATEIPLKESVLHDEYWGNSDYAGEMTVDGYEYLSYEFEGVMIPIDENVPIPREQYGLILQNASLDPSLFRITSVQWAGAPVEQDGTLIRRAAITGDVYNMEYTDYYEGEIEIPDIEYLVYTAHYEEKEELFNARRMADLTLKYKKVKEEQDPSVVQKLGFFNWLKNFIKTPAGIVTTSISALALVAAIIFIVIFLIRKKRKTEEEEA